MAAVKLGSKTAGDIVRIKENDSLVDYIVVHQGRPSSLYDSSCNGTWVMRKECWELKYWDMAENGSKDYGRSNVDDQMNFVFVEALEPAMLRKIKTVKIPYAAYDSDTSSWIITNNPTNIFLLSARETGARSSYPHDFPQDGVKLSYFQNTEQTPDKIANYNGKKQAWWLRSPYTSDPPNAAWYLTTTGQYMCDGVTTHYGARPAFILPAELSVSDDGTVLPNQAPTTPSSLTIPSAIYGGKAVSLSWGASTDPDGNLEGYIVERSVNGGSSWVQVYQGPARTTTNTVPFGTATVTYRVKAYDSEGEFSAYKTSAAVTVINNRAPGAPGSITVPELVQGGGQLAVTWGAAADVDGNLSGYSLERQVDGGAWTEVYNGANLSFTDNITKGWESVAYRVRAYDSHGEYSGYTASGTRAVNNNTPPVISCEETELGVKSADFSVTYQVDDEEEDPVTVSELLDGTELRSFQAELNAENTFSVAGEDFLKLQNGPHSMKISATDGMGESAHEFNFTKEITSASVTLSEPMEADGKITLCALSVKGEIPEDAAFTAEVTNNTKDEAPVWEDCATQVKNGLNYIFENETAQNGFAFNFRIAVERGESGQGGYITSIQGGFQ